MHTCDMIANGAGVDMHGFVRIAYRHDEDIKDQLRTTGGYSEHDLLVLRRTFDKFDSDGSGAVSNHELVELVKQLYPDMATDPKLRPQLLDIVKEADDDGNGELDFWDFVRFTRTVNDLRQEIHMAKERSAVQDTGFSVLELQEF